MIAGCDLIHAAKKAKQPTIGYRNTYIHLYHPPKRPLNDASVVPGPSRPDRLHLRLVTHSSKRTIHTDVSEPSAYRQRKQRIALRWMTNSTCHFCHWTYCFFGAPAG
jgi:hypothetical protein